MGCAQPPWVFFACFFRWEVGCAHPRARSDARTTRRAGHRDTQRQLPGCFRMAFWASAHAPGACFCSSLGLRIVRRPTNRRSESAGVWRPDPGPGRSATARRSSPRFLTIECPGRTCTRASQPPGAPQLRRRPPSMRCRPRKACLRAPAVPARFPGILKLRVRGAKRVVT